MRKKTALLIWIIFLTTTAAVFSSDMMLITDEFWHRLIISEQNQNPVFAARSMLFGILPFGDAEQIYSGGRKLETEKIYLEGTPADYEALLSAASSAAERGIAKLLLSPLLSVYAPRLAADLPDIAVFAYRYEDGSGPSDGADAGAPAGDVHYMKIDYGSAYYEAGAWAAKSGRQVYPVLMQDDGRSAAAMAEFSKGWTASAAAGSEANGQAEDGRPLMRRLDIRRAPEYPELDGWIEELSGKSGYEDQLAAVFAGPLNSIVLTRLADLQIPAVAENSGLWAKSGYKLAAGLEMRPAELLEAAVNYISADIYDEPLLIEADFIVYE